MEFLTIVFVLCYFWGAIGYAISSEEKGPDLYFSSLLWLCALFVGLGGWAAKYKNVGKQERIRKRGREA